MRGWLSPRVECPIDPQSRDWIEQRWQWIIEQFGLDRLRSGRVILPTPEFFPDPYAGTTSDLQVMLYRVCRYMDIEPEVVDLSFYEDKNPVYEGEWRHGTSGLYQEEAGKYRVWIEAQEVNDPMGLVATIAHELGHVHLLGRQRIAPEADDQEPLTDLLTVFFGMGLFTANSVIRENYWAAGAVAGWSMQRRGYLSMPMHGYALAKFARARFEARPAWAKHLRPDVRSAFEKACRFLAAQPAHLSSVSEGQDSAEPQLVQENEVAEEEGPIRRPIAVDELLERYRSGERDFQNVELSGVRLCDTDLHGIDLAGANLSCTDLTASVLTEANLRGADFHGANLRGTALRGSDLSQADLSGANLDAADLTNADIRGTDFTEASLDGAILTDSLRNRATDFSQVDLTKIICNADLRCEDLTGTKVMDRLIEGQQRIRQWVGWFMLVFLAIILGALVGLVVGTALSAALNVKGLTNICVAVGIFLMLGCVWKFRR